MSYVSHEIHIVRNMSSGTRVQDLFMFNPILSFLSSSHQREVGLRIMTSVSGRVIVARYCPLIVPILAQLALSRADQFSTFTLKMTGVGTLVACFLL